MSRSVTASSIHQGDCGYLRKHSSVLCHIGSPDPFPMQDRKPELGAHVPWHFAMDLPPHLKIYNSEVIWIVLRGGQALQKLENSGWTVHGAADASIVNLSQITSLSLTSRPHARSKKHQQTSLLPSASFCLSKIVLPRSDREFALGSFPQEQPSFPHLLADSCCMSHASRSFLTLYSSSSRTRNNLCYAPVSWLHTSHGNQLKLRHGVKELLPEVAGHARC